MLTPRPLDPTCGVPEDRELKKLYFSDSFAGRLLNENEFLAIRCTHAINSSLGKDSICNAGDLGLIPWRRERLPSILTWGIPWTV